jgi:hypothetical protein
MPVVNNNLRMVDLPVWEQLAPAPANSAAGVTMADDNVRFIYILFSATAFWRYDTWTNAWQQLANPTGGTVGVGTTVRYSKQIGGQFNGEVYGSVYALISNGVAAPVLNRYDIATNVWSNLSVTGIPATFGTDAKISYPEPFYNGYIGGYHSPVLQTITTTALANAGATSISVSALPVALPVGTILNFGTYTAPVLAVLTAAAAASATSITVAALIASVPNASAALYYNEMYLVGNGATVIYRYSVNTNAWATTSANAGNPAMPAIPAAVGTGQALKWLPANDANSLFLFRGSNSATLYKYSLTSNTWSTVTYHPATEAISTGSSFGIRSNASAQQSEIVFMKENTNRMYKFNPTLNRVDPYGTQYLFAQGAVVVGDKSCVIKSPDGIEFYYCLLHTSATMLRTPLFI